MSDFMDESLLKDYFDEAYSQIDMMEDNLLKLEKNINDKEAVDSIFRAAHTLKGGSATVQMDEISKFTHLLEDAMDEIRSGKVVINPNIVDTLLSSLDLIKNMVKTRSGGSVYKGEYSNIVEALSKITKGALEASDKQKTKKKVEKEDDSKYKISEYDLMEIAESNPDNFPVYKVVVSFDEANPMRTVGGIQVFTALRDISLVLKTIPDFEEIYSEVFYRDIIYIIASNEPVEKIKEFAVIPDSTMDIKIEPIDKDLISKENTKNLKSTQKEKDLSLDQKAKEITDDALKSLNDTIIIEKEEIIENEKSNSSEEQNKRTMQVVEQKGLASSVLRVDSSRIDDLLNLVSEIVINKATFNQVNLQFYSNLDILLFTMNDYKDKIKNLIEKIPEILNSYKEGKSLSLIKKEIQSEFTSLSSQFDTFASQYKGIIDKFKSTNQNLDRISSSLQEGVMRVRMVPIKQIFNRFPRLVRDLSRDLKKEIELVIEGEDTEVDKAMIDDLIDPLIHIVRNSIDHGFETPEERDKIGKKNPAKLKLVALNEGNMITISVNDDGKGIDVEKIRKKAVEKGLISGDKSLREQEAFNIIFEPGFSTAEKVTNVSGRGVGLDVVKKNIEKLSGSIRVVSEIGKGSTFTIKLPLTLAIIQGLMIKVKDEIYAIPISSVLESIRIKPEEIKTIDNYEVIYVREEVLSLLRLNKLFKITEEEKMDYYYVVIIGSGDKKIGLLVDSLIGEEDIVIKPLKDKYTSTPGIAGATILGDGTVSLILDVSQLIELGLKIEMEKNNQQKNQGGRK
jgi:two-component system, chemotaxis family, sensor kinase CheA